MKIRPLPGHLWTTKYTPGAGQKLRLANGMEFEGSMRESGLFLPSSKSDAVNDVLAKMYVIEAVGEEPPEGWRTKWFLTNANKDHKTLPTRKWNTSFAKEGLSAGVVVAASAKAGLRNELQHEQVQLRHDELVAIGKPLDKCYDRDEFQMFAAPGWVIVKLETSTGQRKSGLTINAAIDTRLTQGSGQWGRVVEVPRNATYEGLGNLCPGMHVCFPHALHAGDHALEWVDFEGGYRALPLMCLLAVGYRSEPADLDEAGMLGFDDGLTAGMFANEGEDFANLNRYQNPYEPQSPAWKTYDLEWAEGVMK